MKNDLSNYRKIYAKGEMDEEVVPEDPFAFFQTWFKEVEDKGGIEEPNAMNVSTVGVDGFPKNRIVLLKEFSQEGFIFYTNYKSEKGLAIEQNSKTCVSFFWPNLERQVIIKGNVSKVSKHVSDKYFKTRPHLSQLGALASNQSEVIQSREIIESELERLKLLYQNQNKPVERPSHWGGYIIKPISFEFWQGRPNRLHDRIQYVLTNMVPKWKIQRLAP